MAALAWRAPSGTRSSMRMARVSPTAGLRSGAELVLDATKFASRITGADLVITGEGRVDAQSAYGKLTQAVTRAARDAGVRAAMIVGGTAPGYEALLEQGLETIEVSTSN